MSYLSEVNDVLAFKDVLRMIMQVQLGAGKGFGGPGGKCICMYHAVPAGSGMGVGRDSGTNRARAAHASPISTNTTCLPTWQCHVVCEACKPELTRNRQVSGYIDMVQHCALFFLVLLLAGGEHEATCTPPPCDKSLFHLPHTLPSLRFRMRLVLNTLWVARPFLSSFPSSLPSFL